MQSFYKLSAGLATVALLFWGASSTQAMMISPPDSDLELSIHGFVSASAGFSSPTKVGKEQPPVHGVTSNEIRINLTMGTEKINAWAQIWDRNSESALGGRDQSHGQVNWMPAEGLEIRAGRLAYLEFTDRAVQWENYVGWTPAIAGQNAYMGYVETNDGIDFAYNLGGDMKVGLAYMTEGMVSGAQTALDEKKTVLKNALKVKKGSDFETEEKSSGKGSIYRTLIPHFQLKGNPLQILASFYLETQEFTEDSWKTTDSKNNTLGILGFKYSLAGGSFAKFDILSRTRDKHSTDTGFSAAYSQGLGDNTVFVEANINTLSYDDENPDDGGKDDVMSNWYRVGFHQTVGVGSKWGVEAFTTTKDEGGTSEAATESWLGLILFQSY